MFFTISGIFAPPGVSYCVLPLLHFIVAFFHLLHSPTVAFSDCCILLFTIVAFFYLSLSHFSIYHCCIPLFTIAPSIPKPPTSSLDQLPNSSLDQLPAFSLDKLSISSPNKQLLPYNLFFGRYLGIHPIFLSNLIFLIANCNYNRFSCDTQHYHCLYIL